MGKLVCRCGFRGPTGKLALARATRKRKPDDALVKVTLFSPSMRFARGRFGGQADGERPRGQARGRWPERRERPTASPSGGLVASGEPRNANQAEDKRQSHKSRGCPGVDKRSAWGQARTMAPRVRSTFFLGRISRRADPYAFRGLSAPRTEDLPDHARCAARQAEPWRSARPPQ